MEIKIDNIIQKGLTYEQKEGLMTLYENILNPLQKEWVKLDHEPFVITTYLDGGKKYHKSSSHLSGEAVDISAGDKLLNEELFILAQNLNLPYNYIISENNFRNIHISIGLRRKRKAIKIPFQVLNVIK